MFGIVFLFFSLFTIGIFLILLDVFKMPTLKAEKAIAKINKHKKKENNPLDDLIWSLSVKLSKYIPIDSFKRKELEVRLKSGGITLTPETYIAKAFVKSGLVLLGIVPVLFIIPFLAPVIILLSIAIYFKELNAGDKAIKRKEEIEWELPRFVSTITQELKSSRDVLSMLENYKNNAGESFRKELEITTADMKSANYETALIRLETRVASSQLSEVTRGLVSVLRGDDGVVYFQMLSHDLKQLELQRLKQVAMKRPGKIKKFSLLLLLCFVLTYIVVLGIQLGSSMGKLF